MIQPFVPERPEIKIRVVITAREACLIKKLRLISFGKIIVEKVNNIITRIVPNESIIIKEEDGLDMGDIIGTVDKEEEKDLK